jgi:hypothetical protein
MAVFVVNSDGSAKDYKRFSCKRTVGIGPDGAGLLPPEASLHIIATGSGDRWMVAPAVRNPMPPIHPMGR